RALTLSSLSLLFFLLMIPRPPKSTLFPYNDALPIYTFKYIERVAERIFPNGVEDAWCVDCGLSYEGPPETNFSGGEHLAGKIVRSEEHTSELQSRENLVCRLLLEKKNSVSLLLL